MSAELTPRQRQVLDFITGQVRDRGHAPTYGEIADHFGWVGNNASLIHIKALVRKGHLLSRPGTARGLQVPGLPWHPPSPAAGLGPLTEAQHRILELILGATRDRGQPPSWRELAAAAGFASHNGVKCHLKALVRKGYLEIDRGKSRSLKVLAVPARDEETSRA